MKKSALLTTFLLCLTVWLTGCLGVSSTPFEALAPQADEALVYVYRPESIWFRGSPYIVYADDAKYDSLINNAYYPFRLKPGLIFFRLTRQGNLFKEERVDALEMKVAAGQTYYLKVEPRPAGAFKLVPMDPAQGRAEAAKTKYFQTR
jgi:hypothetical protein